MRTPTVSPARRLRATLRSAGRSSAGNTRTGTSSACSWNHCRPSWPSSTKGEHVMIDLKQREAWFVTGSQSLYGKETLDKVAEHAREIARELSASSAIPVTVVFKPVVTTPDAIVEVCRDANSAKNCVGLVAWMHTF